MSVGRRSIAFAAVAVSVAGLVAAGGATASAASASPGHLVTFGASRLFDTRSGTDVRKGSVKAGASITVAVTGHARIPASGAAAIQIQLSAVTPAGSGQLLVGSSTLPAVDFSAHHSTTNTVLTTLNANGTLTIRNASKKAVHIVGKVLGYVVPGIPDSARAYAAIAPARVVDTAHRVGTAITSLHGRSTVILQLAGRGGVPVQDVGAVAVNLRTGSATAGGSFSAWASGRGKSTARIGAYSSGATAGHYLLLPVGADGKVVLKNNGSRPVKFTIDVQGYRFVNPIGLPTVSAGHYVRTANSNLLDLNGCTDATNSGTGARRAVLDIGAQTVTSLASPGVRLSATDTRLTYAQLNAAILSYVGGYVRCRAAGARLTVAVAANSDGAFSGANAYPASTRGADWATEVVGALNTAAPSGVDFVGAFDAEADFTASAGQALQWEQAYLAHSASQLVFIGAASNCPLVLGQINRSCGPVNIDDDPANGTNTWRQTDLAQLAGASSNGRIVALPQIYNAQNAVQWANISRTRRVSVIGALTEAAVDAQVPPVNGAQPSQQNDVASYQLWTQLQTSANTDVRTFTVGVDLDQII